MRNKLILFFSVLLLLTLGNVGLTAAQESLVDWTTIFNADGSVNNLGGGFDAVFLEDKISADVATDMTALDPATGFVINGPVKTAHDLGNGYVLASRDTSGNLLLYAAAERINSKSNTFVEIEFNQGDVGLIPGNPWPIYGARTVNDIKVFFNYSAGNLTSVSIGTWNGSSFVSESYAVSSQPGCLILSSAADFCNGTPPAGLPLANQEVWDADYNVVQVPSADSFLEISINIGNLLGSNVEFKSIVVSTPQDIALGSFQAMSYASAH